MQFWVFGINYKTAPIEFREKMSLSKEAKSTFLRFLSEKNLCKEAILLSTCHRCEIYVVTDQINAIITAFCQLQQLSLDSFISLHYQYAEYDAIQHLMRVAAGLDSLILGEPQIFGQLKYAFKQALEQNTIGSKLHYIFQASFSTAKVVRHSAEVGYASRSLSSFIAQRYLKPRLSKENTLKIIGIGAGEMLHEILSQMPQTVLQQANCSLYTRRPETAERFHPYCGEKIYSMTHLRTALKTADVVITASSASHYLITSEDLDPTAHPSCFLDLAVPRDIDPAIKQHYPVTLLNIDELSSQLAKHAKIEESARKTAEKMIKKAATTCHDKHYLADTYTAFIANYRKKADDIQQHTLMEAKAALSAGHCPHTLLEKMAKQLTARLLHEPTVHLKDMLCSHAKTNYQAYLDQESCLNAKTVLAEENK